MSLERTFLGTQRQAASGVSRVRRCALEQWQAVTMGVGRVARVALCHGECCWARRVGAAVPWGLLLGVSRGCRCAMGIARGWRCAMGLIAGQDVVWVAPCH